MCPPLHPSLRSSTAIQQIYANASAHDRPDLRPHRSKKARVPLNKQGGSFQDIRESGLSVHVTFLHFRSFRRCSVLTERTNQNNRSAPSVRGVGSMRRIYHPFVPGNQACQTHRLIPNRALFVSLGGPCAVLQLHPATSSHLRYQSLQGLSIHPTLILPSPATRSDYVSFHPAPSAHCLVHTWHSQGDGRSVREPIWVKYPRSAVSNAVSKTEPRSPPSSPRNAEQMWDAGTQSVRCGRCSQQAALAPPTSQYPSKRTLDATVLDLICCYTSESSLSRGPSPNVFGTSTQDVTTCSSALFDFGFPVETSPHCRNERAEQIQLSLGESDQETAGTFQSFEAQEPVQSSETTLEQGPRLSLDQPQFVQSSRLYVVEDRRGHDGTVCPLRRSGSRRESFLTRASVDRVKREPAPLQLKAGSPISSCRSEDGLTASSTGLSTPVETAHCALYALQHTVSVLEDDDEGTRLMDFIKWLFHSSTKRPVSHCLDAEKTQKIEKRNFKRVLLRLLTCDYTSSKS